MVLVSGKLHKRKKSCAQDGGLFIDDRVPSPEEYLAWLESREEPFLWALERDIAAQRAFVAYRSALAQGADPTNTRIEDFYVSRSGEELAELNKLMTLAYQTFGKTWQDATADEQVLGILSEFYDFWKHLTPELAEWVAVDLFYLPAFENTGKELCEETRLLMCLCHELIYGVGEKSELLMELPPPAKEAHYFCAFEVGPESNILANSDSEVCNCMLLADLVLQEVAKKKG